MSAYRRQGSSILRALRQVNAPDPDG